jgi:hypothetical protein
MCLRGTGNELADIEEKRQTFGPACQRGKDKQISVLDAGRGNGGQQQKAGQANIKG